MPGNYYFRPRARAKLIVPVMGSASERTSQASDTSVVAYEINVSRVVHTSNDHNAADELELEGNWNEIGTDPRLLSNAEVYCWMGDAGTSGQVEAIDKNLRFVGIVVDAHRALSEDKKQVVIRAHDYTTLFLKSKPFPETGVPDYTQSLTEAWGRICDNTGAWDFVTKKIVSTVQAMRDRIDFVGVDASINLGKAVAKRFAKFGKVQLRATDDAWAVWQRCVGSLGLISFIRRDRCIVTTATDYYTADDPPRMIWGQNISKLREGRDVNSLSGKGVALTSFDPLTGSTIEAFYPPDSDQSKGKKKRVVASAKGAPQAVVVKDYEFFQYPGVTDPDVLAICCQRAYEERSRQELTGEWESAEAFVDTVDGRKFDLMNLNSGDRVRIELEQGVVNDLLRIPVPSARVKYLTDRGYDQGLAQLMAKNIESLGRLGSDFQVRNVRTTLETDKDGGTFEVVCQFINRIEISGAALQKGA